MKTTMHVACPRQHRKHTVAVLVALVDASLGHAPERGLPCTALRGALQKSIAVAVSFPLLKPDQNSIAEAVGIQRHVVAAC